MSTPQEELRQSTKTLREVHLEEISWRDQRIKRLEELLAGLAVEVDRLQADDRKVETL